MHVLCDFEATWHQEAYFSVSWIHHGSTSCLCLYFTFLVKVLPPPFQYSFGVYLYLFLLYILLSQNWQQDQFQYLRYPKKCIIPSSRNISVTKKSSICKEYTHESICISLVKKKPYISPFTDVQRTALGSTMYKVD